MHDLSLPQEHLHAAPHWVHWQAEPRPLSVSQTFGVFGDGVRHLFQSAVFHLPVAIAIAFLHAMLGGLLAATLGRLPVVGPFLVVPILVVVFSLALAGWLRATHRLAHLRMRDEPTDYRAALHDLLSGFQERPGPLAAYAFGLWCLSMTAAVGVTLLATLAFAPADSSSMVGSGVMALALGLLVACLLSPLAAWQLLFLAQASVTRLPLKEAVKSAALAIRRNALPLMALGAIIIVAMTLIGGFSGFVAGGLGALTRSRWVGVLCFVPAALLFSSIGPAMTYALAQRLFDRLAPAPDPVPAAERTASTALPDASHFRAAPVSRDDPWTLALLRAIDALRFGEMCMMYFRIAGFAVQARPSLSDGASRFALAPEALPDKPVMLVDAMAWGTPSDLARIRHFRLSMQRSQLERGTMVAASGFTPEAVQEARFAKIRLIDGAELLTLILKLPEQQQQVLRDMAFPDTSPTL